MNHPDTPLYPHNNRSSLYSYFGCLRCVALTSVDLRPDSLSEFAYAGNLRLDPTQQRLEMTVAAVAYDPENGLDRRHLPVLIYVVL